MRILLMISMLTWSTAALSLQVQPPLPEKFAFFANRTDVQRAVQGDLLDPENTKEVSPDEMSELVQNVRILLGGDVDTFSLCEDMGTCLVLGTMSLFEYLFKDSPEAKKQEPCATSPGESNQPERCERRRGQILL